MSTLTSEHLKAIAAKIAEVEKQTAGEIVVHVVGRSDGYGAYRLGWAAVLAAVVAKATLNVVGASAEPWALEIAAGLTLVLWTVFGWGPVLRRLVPTTVKGYRVHRRAEAAFIENRVHRTRDASGVLILVSLLERRVEILADEGIHAKVGVDGWKTHVKRIIDGMKTNAPAAGIIETIGKIGAELKTDVPIRPDDENELSNEVVVSQN